MSGEKRGGASCPLVRKNSVLVQRRVVEGDAIRSIDIFQPPVSRGELIFKPCLIRNQEPNMPPRIIARQLSRPKGALGVLVAQLMNRGNARMNAFAVRQLELAASDHVLEIGFGGGLTLPSLLEGAAYVAGVDRSPDMVRRAKSRFSEAMAAGRANFCEGRVEALPFGPGLFAKVCTVNTVYFWSALGAGCAEIHRVLQPGGRVAIGFLPKERMDQMGFPRDIFTSRSPDEVVAALVQEGFNSIRIERPEPATPWNVVVATR